MTPPCVAYVLGSTRIYLNSICGKGASSKGGASSRLPVFAPLPRLPLSCFFVWLVCGCLLAFCFVLVARPRERGGAPPTTPHDARNRKGWLCVAWGGRVRDMEAARIRVASIKAQIATSDELVASTAGTLAAARRANEQARAQRRHLQSELVAAEEQLSAADQQFREGACFKKTKVDENSRCPLLSSLDNDLLIRCASYLDPNATWTYEHYVRPYSARSSEIVGKRGRSPGISGRLGGRARCTAQVRGRVRHQTLPRAPLDAARVHLWHSVEA